MMYVSGCESCPPLGRLAQFPAVPIAMSVRSTNVHVDSLGIFEGEAEFGQEFAPVGSTATVWS